MNLIDDIPVFIDKKTSKASIDIEDLVIYKPRFAWAIFQYDDNADLETWHFHSAHWNRARARRFSKNIEGKTRVRKIDYEVVTNS